MILLIGVLSALSTFAWLWITNERTERHEPLAARLGTYGAAFASTIIGLCGIAALGSLSPIDSVVSVGCVVYQLASLLGAGVVWLGESRVRV